MTEITLGIKGMTCQMCVRHVREALEKLKGVDRADVDLQKKEARITYDETKASVDEMRKAVKEAGYEPL
ncbi:MAG: heavy metal-associated domain-containing protein [bacterium]